MTDASGRWDRVKEVFQAALDRPSETRAAFVRDVCGDDQHLRTEVDSLLLAHERAGSFVERAALEEWADVAMRGRDGRDRQLQPGDQLGPYQIAEQLGAGGMGEVFKARDTRLDRTVAIKLLPWYLRDDPDLKQRFEREAKTLATLSHPHICPVFDVGRQDSSTSPGQAIDFLVMEYLEGDTLADRLGRSKDHRLQIHEALTIGIQIASALDAAHRAGIVHRDLKPGNVMLTKTGAKLLDFGLAKTNPVQVVGQSMASTAAPLTAEGTILGTVQYMAPEQLEGKDADARTDVFAFGALLYEMVTGRRAFEGQNQISLIAAIVEHDPPPISSLQPVSPPLLDHLVKTCLAKHADDRWQSMRDVLFPLTLIAERGGVSATIAAASKVTRRQLGLAWAAAAVSLLLAGAVTTALLLSDRRGPEAAKMTFEVAMPSPAGSASLSPTLALSPDGRQLAAMVFSSRGPELRIRALEKLDTRALFSSPNDVSGAVFPFWSPDSRFVAYFADGKLQKIDIFGNPPQAVCDAAAGSGGTWNRDGVIVFAPTQTSPLFRVSDSGGKPIQITEFDGARQETAHRDPYFLPDGKHFLYLAVSSKPENSAIYVGSLDSKERKRVLGSTFKALFAAPGHIVFLRETTLMAQAFDLERLELRGDPFRVAEHVAVLTATATAPVAGFTVSEQGTLAYRTAGSTERHLLWFDRSGRQLGEVGVPSSTYDTPALSPDLQRVAVGNQGDIWLLDLVRGGASRFTFNPAIDDTPLWSTDGGRVVFQSNRDGGTFNLYVKNSGGGGQEELLLKSNYPKWPEDWSPDGGVLLYTEQSSSSSGVISLWTMSVNGDRKPQRVVQTPFVDAQGRFSPDGRWIAYASNESGRAEVYAQRFPTTGSRWQVSTAGGAQPRWRRDGKELLFMSLAGEAMAVDISTPRDGVFQAGTPRRLFQANPASVFTGRNSWDVTPDGQRFLITSVGTAPPITVIVNWAAGTGTKYPIAQ